MKIITPIIVIIISITVYFAYTSPIIQEVKNLVSKKSQQTDVLLKTRQLASRRDAVLIDYNNIVSTDIERLNKIVPNTFNFVLFANDVTAMASRYSLVTKDFKVNEPKTEIRDAIINRPKEGVYKITVVTVRLQGSYLQFIKFLNDLEFSLRLVDIESLTIKPVGVQNSASGSLDYLLEMKTYSLVERETEIDTLALVDKLKTISIDQNVFSSPIFSSLKDFTQTIFPEQQGRTNPFSTIGSDIFFSGNIQQKTQ